MISLAIDTARGALTKIQQPCQDADFFPGCTGNVGSADITATPTPGHPF